MKRKVSTILDESLFRRTKMESARKGMQISEVISEALELYLGAGKEGASGPGVVAESWGSLKVSSRRLKKVMEEDGLLDS